MEQRPEPERGTPSGEQEARDERDGRGNPVAPPDAGNPTGWRPRAPAHGEPAQGDRQQAPWGGPGRYAGPMHGQPAPSGGHDARQWGSGAAPSGPQRPAADQDLPGGPQYAYGQRGGPSGPRPAPPGGWSPDAPGHGQGTPPGGVSGYPGPGALPPTPYAVEPPRPHEPTGPNQAPWAGHSGPQRPPVPPGGTATPRTFAQDSIAEAFLSGTPMPAPPTRQPPAPPEQPQQPQGPQQYGPGPTQSPPEQRTSWSQPSQWPQLRRPPEQQAPWQPRPDPAVPADRSASAAPPAPPVTPSAPSRPEPPSEQERTGGRRPPGGQEAPPHGGTPSDSRPREELPPARAWFGTATSSSSEASRPPVPPGTTREPRRVGPPRPADPVSVNPGGEEDSPDPDAVETGFFLVMGADRRARKTREEGLETPRAGENAGSAEPSTASETSPGPDAPEPEAAEPGRAEGTDPSPEGPEPVRPDTDTVRVQAPPPVDPADSSDTGGGAASRSAPGPVASVPGAGRESAPPGAGEPEQAAPYFTYGGRPPEPTGFPDIPAAPYAGAGQPEPGRGVLRTEGRLDPPTPYDPAANAPSTQVPAQDLSARTFSAQGIESWIDAVGDARTPVQGGYEQGIAAVRSVPASPWRRAVFAVTGGRLNLG